jgi:hypothetical protein
MDILKVALLEPTTEGRIYYSRDHTIEPEVLFIETKVDRPKAFGINLEGGSVLLKLDANHILKSAEFVYHRRAWKISQIEIPEPKYTRDIQLPNVELWYNGFEMDVTAVTDEQYHYVQFRFYKFSGEEEWIALSDECYALIVEGNLCGFFIKLFD